MLPRAVGHRSYRPLFPHLGRAAVGQLALEFASREMAEVDLLGQLPDTMGVAVGLVDVKNTWVEPPELAAERLRLDVHQRVYSMSAKSLDVFICHHAKPAMPSSRAPVTTT